LTTPVKFEATPGGAGSELDRNIRLSTHFSQLAGILISVVTELQAYFRFDDAGARINERIHEVWNALLPRFTVKELYDGRYAKLMEDRGIKP
jgi:hypothetical protein